MVNPKGPTNAWNAASSCGALIERLGCSAIQQPLRVTGTLSDTV